MLYSSVDFSIPHDTKKKYHQKKKQKKKTKKQAKLKMQPKQHI